MESSYVIIGGGISGLYAAYSLHKKFGVTNIQIIEKSNRLGGRINSMDLGDIVLEMGAGAITNGHSNMLNLIKDLGLDDQLMEGSGDRSILLTDTIPTNKYITGYEEIIPTIYKITSSVNILDTIFYQIIDELLERLRDPVFFEMASNYSLYSLIEKFYGEDRAIFMVQQFGYHADFYEQNSIQGLRMFIKDFPPKTKFIMIKKGLIQIINALEDYLRKHDIKIRTGIGCKDIKKIDNAGIEASKHNLSLFEQGNKYYCLMDNNDEIIADNIIFAVTKKDLMGIKYLEPIYDNLNFVTEKSLIRIYAEFPRLVTGKVWFDDIQSVVTTKTIFNQIIPVSKGKGIIMFYCDSLNADMWNGFYQKGILERELLFHLSKLFSDKIIDRPSNIHVSYYAAATHMLRKSTCSACTFSNMLEKM